MKKLFVIASVLVGSAALACPNLAGKYSPKAGGEARVTIEQKDADGVTAYSIKHEKKDDQDKPNIFSQFLDFPEIIADGQPHDVPVKDGTPYTYTAVCTQGSLSVTADGVSNHHGQEVKVHASGSFAVKEQGKLYSEFAGRGEIGESYHAVGFGRPLFKVQ